MHLAYNATSTLYVQQHHQLWVSYQKATCWRMQALVCLVIVKFTRTHIHMCKDRPYRIHYIILLYHVCRVKQSETSVSSNKYRVGDMVTLTSDPQFRTINKIVITQQDKCIFVLSEIESVAQPHYHTYDVSLSTDTVCKLI